MSNTANGSDEFASSVTQKLILWGKESFPKVTSVWAVPECIYLFPPIYMAYMEEEEQGQDMSRESHSSQGGNSGNFANDPQRASEAGQKGGSR